MNSIITTDAWSYKLFEQYLNTFFRELKVNLEKHIIPSQDSPLFTLYTEQPDTLILLIHLMYLTRLFMAQFSIFQLRVITDINVVLFCKT